MRKIYLKSLRDMRRMKVRVASIWLLVAVVVFVYAGGFKTGLWVSSDAGTSWKLLWQDPAVEAISSIYVHQNDERHLMVGTTGQGIFESLDGGATWRSAGLQGCQVRQIGIYP